MQSLIHLGIKHTVSLLKSLTKLQVGFFETPVTINYVPNVQILIAAPLVHRLAFGCAIGLSRQNADTRIEQHVYNVVQKFNRKLKLACNCNSKKRKNVKGSSFPSWTHINQCLFSSATYFLATSTQSPAASPNDRSTPKPDY